MVATAAVRSRRCLACQCAQALVLFATGRAACQVGAEPGDRCLNIEAANLEIDVSVEFIEANVAGFLRLCRPEQAADRFVQVSIRHQVFSFDQVSSASPAW